MIIDKKSKLVEFSALDAIASVIQKTGAVVYTATNGAGGGSLSRYTNYTASVNIIAGAYNQNISGDNFISVTNVSADTIYGGVIITSNPAKATTSKKYTPVNATLTGDVAISVLNGNFGTIYGGGSGLGSAVNGNIDINFAGSNVKTIYGGGSNGNVVNGDVHIKLSGDTGKVYGGGYNATVNGDVTIELGNDAALRKCSLVSGTGVGKNAIVSGTKTLLFNDYTGNFNGKITNFDVIRFSGNSGVTISRTADKSILGANYDFNITDNSLGKQQPMLNWSSKTKLQNITITMTVSNGDYFTNGGNVKFLASKYFTTATSLDTSLISVYNDEGNKVSQYVYQLNYVYDAKTGGYATFDYKGTKLQIIGTVTDDIVLASVGDVVTVQAGSQLNGRLDTSSGDDRVVVNANAEINNDLRLGSGNNTLIVNAGGSVTGSLILCADSNNVITLNNGSILGVELEGDAQTIWSTFNINGGGVGYWTGSGSGRTFVSTSDLILGDSNDTVVFSGVSSVRAINFGKGFDTIVLNNNFNGQQLIFGDGGNAIVIAATMTVDAIKLSLGNTNNALVVTNGQIATVTGYSFGKYLSGNSAFDAIYLSQNAILILDDTKSIQNYIGTITDANSAYTVIGENVPMDATMQKQFGSYYQVQTAGVVDSTLTVKSLTLVADSLVDDSTVTANSVTVGRDAALTDSIINVADTFAVNGGNADQISVVDTSGNLIVSVSQSSADTNGVIDSGVISNSYIKAKDLNIGENIVFADNDVKTTGNMTVGENATVSGGTLNIGGLLSLGFNAVLTATNTILANSMHIGSGVSFTGTAVMVAGNLAMDDATAVTGNFIVGGDTSFTGTADYLNMKLSTGRVIVADNTEILLGDVSAQTFVIGKNAVIASDFQKAIWLGTVTKALTIGGDLTNIYITGDLSAPLTLNGSYNLVYGNNRTSILDYQQITVKAGETLTLELMNGTMLAVDGDVADPGQLINTATLGSNAVLGIGSTAVIGSWTRDFDFDTETNVRLQNAFATTISFKDLTVLESAVVWGKIAMDDAANLVTVQQGAKLHGDLTQYDLAAITTKGGNDTVIIGDANTVAGVKATEIFGSIQTGAGDDTVKLYNATVYGNVLLNQDGSIESNRLEAANAAINGYLQTGEGADTVIAQNLTVGGYIDLGNGSNTLALTDSAVTGDVKSGASSTDNITLDDTTVGGNVILGSANTLTLSGITSVGTIKNADLLATINVIDVTGATLTAGAIGLNSLLSNDVAFTGSTANIGGNFTLTSLHNRVSFDNSAVTVGGDIVWTGLADNALYLGQNQAAGSGAVTDLAANAVSLTANGAVTLTALANSVNLGRVISLAQNDSVQWGDATVSYSADATNIAGSSNQLLLGTQISGDANDVATSAQLGDTTVNAQGTFNLGSTSATNVSGINNVFTAGLLLSALNGADYTFGDTGVSAGNSVLTGISNVVKVGVYATANSPHHVNSSTINAGTTDITLGNLSLTGNESVNSAAVGLNLTANNDGSIILGDTTITTGNVSLAGIANTLKVTAEIATYNLLAVNVKSLTVNTGTLELEAATAGSGAPTNTLIVGVTAYIGDSSMIDSIAINVNGSIALYGVGDTAANTLQLLDYSKVSGNITVGNVKHDLSGGTYAYTAINNVSLNINALTGNDSSTVKILGLTNNLTVSTGEGANSSNRVIRLYGATNNLTVAAGATLNGDITFGGIYDPSGYGLWAGIGNAVNNVEIYGSVKSVNTMYETNQGPYLINKLSNSVDTVNVYSGATVQQAITTGANNDAVNIWGSAGSIATGSDSDTISLFGAQITGNVNGGDGTDTLIIHNINNWIGGDLSEVETVNLGSVRGTVIDGNISDIVNLNFDLTYGDLLQGYDNSILSNATTFSNFTYQTLTDGLNSKSGWFTVSSTYNSGTQLTETGSSGNYRLSIVAY